MSIVDDIKNAVLSIVVGDPGEEVPVFSFIHGTDGVTNLEADDVTFPVCILAEPMESIDRVHMSGSISEEYQVEIGFFNKVDFGASPSVHRAIVDRMRLYRAQFIGRLIKDGRIAVVSMRTLDAMEALDVNVSGVVVTLSIAKTLERNDGGAGYC